MSSRDLRAKHQYLLVDAGDTIATITIERQGDTSSHQPGSKSHDGWFARCEPIHDVPIAIDLESSNNPVAASLARRFGVSVREFLNHWTWLECIAKLSNTPVHILLKRYPPGASSRLTRDFPVYSRAIFYWRSCHITVMWQATAPRLIKSRDKLRDVGLGCDAYTSTATLDAFAPASTSSKRTPTIEDTPGSSMVTP